VQAQLDLDDFFIGEGFYEYDDLYRRNVRSATTSKRSESRGTVVINHDRRASSPVNAEDEAGQLEEEMLNSWDRKSFVNSLIKVRIFGVKTNDQVRVVLPKTDMEALQVLQHIADNSGDQSFVYRARLKTDQGDTYLYIVPNKLGLNEDHVIQEDERQLEASYIDDLFRYYRDPNTNRLMQIIDVDLTNIEVDDGAPISEQPSSSPVVDQQSAELAENEEAFDVDATPPK